MGLCIVIYTTSSFKHWAIEREIAQIRKMKAAEAWFIFEGTSLSCSSSESGSGLGKPGTRPRCCCCCCCCWCGRFPVRSKNTFTLAHFGPQPPVLFGSTTGMGENHIQFSNRDCGMPQCFFNYAPRLLHTRCTRMAPTLPSSLLDPCSQLSDSPILGPDPATAPGVT